jgi:hypothetical protein
VDAKQDRLLPGTAARGATESLCQTPLTYLEFFSLGDLVHTWGRKEARMISDIEAKPGRRAEALGADGFSRSASF